jgi:hypothetical protein
MKKIIEKNGIDFICTDEVSKDNINNIKLALSLIEQFVSNCPDAINLIEDAMVQGLTEVIFTSNDKNVVGRGCQNGNIIKINANLDSIEIIDVLLFELYNVVNLELNNIHYYEYNDAETYADEKEKAEYNTFINHKNLIIKLLQLPDNKQILEKALLELSFPITYEEIIQEKEKLYSFNEYLDVEHREIYVKQWLEYGNPPQKQLPKRVEFSRNKEGDSINDNIKAQ